MINIKGLNKAEVLFALWKGSHCQGMSFLGMVNGGFTLERAQDMIREIQVNAFKRSGEAPELTPENNDEYIVKFNAWVKTNPDVQLYFDYVDGHVIKCDISGDEFDPRLYTVVKAEPQRSLKLSETARRYQIRCQNLTTSLDVCSIS